MLGVIANLLLGLLYYVPAFVANGSGPFVKKGTPIDMGRNFLDGRRILGDGKTFEGLMVAVTFGTTIGVVISRFFGVEWVLVSLVESVFAMLGDMAGAFVKRRLNIPRGGRALGLDQLDFVFGATIGLLLLGVSINLFQFLFVAGVAFVMHVFTNNVAYRLKIKSVPW
ncbi:MAG: CDP-2,3-bis-(O-geranylgeranyl)-sn-glycerol synthase [Candidatus Aramenus sp.]|nr:CDP-2,3-bis-(O-geranylgeranyl)-sn-glycerol synthase [Candidatus Aramenus sp.]